MQWELNLKKTLQERNLRFFSKSCTGISKRSMQRDVKYWKEVLRFDGLVYEVAHG